MKKNWLTVLMAIALLTIPIIGNCAAQAGQQGNGIQWMSYEEGSKRGEAENKKLMMVFNADWCRYCRKMAKDTFRDTSVIAYVNRKFIPISVNTDKDQATATKFNVMGLPSTWFIAEDGEKIGNRPGYIPPKEMLTILKYIGSDSYKKMSFKAFIDKNK